MGKPGGPKHKPVEHIDECVLMEVFSRHKKDLIEFGPYEGISRPQSSSGPGLAVNVELLLAIVAVAPGAEIPTAVARTALIRMLMNNPELNRSCYNTETYAGLRVDKLCTMLNHVRRFHPTRDFDGKVFEKACKTCTSGQVISLKSLVSMMRINPEGSEAETQWVDPAEAVSPLPKRKLKAQLSLDSQGFPLALASPVVAPKRRLVAKTHQKHQGSPLALQIWAFRQRLWIMLAVLVFWRRAPKTDLEPRNLLLRKLEGSILKCLAIKFLQGVIVQLRLGQHLKPRPRLLRPRPEPRPSHRPSPRLRLSLKPKQRLKHQQVLPDSIGSTCGTRTTTALASDA